MKKNLHRSLYILTSFVLLFFTLFPLLSYADDYVDWRLSEDGNTLTDGVNEYTRYLLPVGVFADAKTEYVYENTIWADMPLSSVRPGGDIVWGGDSADICVYANAAGKQTLDSFLNDDIGIYRIFNEESGEAMLDVSVVQKLESLNENAKTVKVSELRNVPINVLYLYDTSDVFCREYGAVYTLAGEFYYLGYEDLPNEHFDAYGSFSYRSGEVTLHRVDDGTKAVLDSALADAKYRGYDVTWESDEDLFAYEEAFFWPAYIFWGFVLPVVFLVLGIALPRLPRKAKSPMWYALVPVSGVWIVLAAILLIILM